MRRFGIGLPRKQDKTSEQPNKAAQECRTPKSGQSACQRYESRSPDRLYTLLFHNQDPPLNFFTCISWNIKHFKANPLRQDIQTG
jgi:hypothetical protein